MGKKNSGSSDRASKIAKAGKRSGQTVYPASISAERRAAKDQGEQQFYSTTPITTEIERTRIEWDKALRGAVIRTRKVIVNTEHRFDESRGRVITNPAFQAKVNKDKANR